MGSPAAGPLRLARAAAFGTVAFALALVAHVSGGRSDPAAGHTDVLAGGVAGGSVLVTGRRCGGARLLGLGAVQVGLHVAFMALAPAAGCRTVTLPASPSRRPVSVTSCPPCRWLGSPGSGSPLPMVLAHAGATVALAVLLARGDRALWLLATLLLPALSVALCAALAHPGGPCSDARFPVLWPRPDGLQRGRAARAAPRARPLRLTSAASATSGFYVGLPRVPGCIAVLRPTAAVPAVPLPGPAPPSPFVRSARLLPASSRLEGQPHVCSRHEDDHVTRRLPSGAEGGPRVSPPLPPQRSPPRWPAPAPPRRTFTLSRTRPPPAATPS